jgi:hypothetical protein
MEDEPRADSADPECRPIGETARTESAGSVEPAQLRELAAAQHRESPT